MPSRARKRVGRAMRRLGGGHGQCKKPEGWTVPGVLKKVRGPGGHGKQPEWGEQGAEQEAVGTGR